MHSTLFRVFLTSFASLVLVCLPSPSLAQHGGGGHAGGGSHAAGGGGGFHGGGYSGGIHGHGGGYRGSSRGSAGGYGMHGNYGMGSASRLVSSRPWASEGQGVRNTSPGWHSFERGSSGAAASRSGAAAARSNAPGFSARSNVASHQAIADGNWHSFAGERGGNTLLASNFHSEFAGGITRAGFVGGNAAWRGFPYRAGYGWGGYGWRGGWGWGGWGWGWGCCGWGFGWGPAWGWGWGLGFGLGWGPYWDWPPYAYNPWWYDYPDGYGY